MRKLIPVAGVMFLVLVAGACELPSGSRRAAIVDQVAELAEVADIVQYEENASLLGRSIKVSVWKGSSSSGKLRPQGDDLRGRRPE